MKIAKHINKFIIIFLVVVSLLVFFSWKILQSEKVANLISAKITEEVSKYYDFEFKFRKIEIGLFPPSTHFHDVEFYDEEKDPFFNIKISRLSVYYGLIDLLSNEISVRDLVLERGEISLSDKVIDNEKNKNDSRTPSEKINSTITQVKDFLKEDLPFQLNRISINNFEFKIISKISTHIEELVASRIGKKIYINFQLEEVKDKNKEFLPFDNIDLIEFDALLSADNLFINNFSFMKDLDKVSSKGELSFGSKELNFNLQSEMTGDFIKYIPDFKNENHGIKGVQEINLNIKGDLSSLKVDGNIEIENFVSKYMLADKLDLKFLIDNSLLSILNINIQRNSGLINIEEPFKVYDFKNKRALLNSIKGNFDNILTNDALYYLPDLKPVKGRLTGIANFTFLENKLVFNGTDLLVKNFSLEFDEGKPGIISIPEVRLKTWNVGVGKDDVLDLNFEMKFKNSNLNIKGKKDSDGFDLISENSVIDFEELGPISKTVITGKGPISISVTGDKNVSLKFNGQFNNFSVEDFYIGNTTADFEYLIRDKQFNIFSLSSEIENGKIFGEGRIQFGDTARPHLKIKTKNLILKDSNKIYKKIIPSADFIPEGMTATYDADFEVLGDFSENGLKVLGSINSNDFSYIKESLDHLNVKFEYNNKKLLVQKIKALKSNGLINGKFQYDFRNKSYEYESNFKNMKLSDLKFYEILGLGLDADLVLELKGFGNEKESDIYAKINLENSYIGESKQQDSILKVVGHNGDLFVDGNFLGEYLKLKSYLNLNQSNPRKSSIFVEFNFTDFKNIFGILSEHNIGESKVRGFLKGFMDLNFSFFEKSKLDFEFKLQKFLLGNPTVELTSVKSNDQIIIKDGKILEWSLLLKDKMEKISSNGSGDLINGFNIETDLNLSANWLEVLSSDLKKIKGRIFSNFKLFGDINKVSTDIRIKGEDLQVGHTQVPGIFDNLNFDVFIGPKEILLQHMSSNYGAGKVSGSGVLVYGIPFPVIDFKFKFNGTRVPLFKRSGIVISGDSKIQGKKLPYLLTADFVVNSGEILDSFDEILKKGGDEGDYEKYLPEKKLVDTNNLIDLNISGDIPHPLTLKNNLAYVLFDGNMRIAGTPQNPLLRGDLRFIPTVSKFVFRGNEFYLSEGHLKLLENPTRIEPEYKFIGNSKINEYDIRIEVDGKNDKFNINFNSDPSLGKEDILSLLTIGVTADTSKKLQDSDRQSITSIGIGSLLVDQFQLNEGITSSLGLRLSVSPEFSEDQIVGPIEERTNSGTSSATKIKSGTKIRLKKELSKKVDFSVSSIVGGTLEQKQEMNLDLNLSKNISIQGVYEVKSSAETDTSDSPTSLGADIIFKWSFK